MKYLSVCSGIEAATVAWHPLGWKPLAFSEIEPFPRAVLAHHYPSVPCYGDFTKLRDETWIEDSDILVGGTPCQAFSIAGQRQSLSDDRGNLTLEFVRLADAIDNFRRIGNRNPAIIVWENVPGVLSVKDNAFGCFLAALVGNDTALVPTGGRWTNAGMVIGPKRAAAWRILDAQYFGVAQRRRRVFVVASARNGFDPAEVLFEHNGVRRDTAPSRGPGQEITGTLEASIGTSRGAGTPTSILNAEESVFSASSIGAYKEGIGTLRANGGDNGGGSENLVVGTMIANNGGGGWSNSIDKATAGYMVPVAFHPTQTPISSEDGTTHTLNCGSSSGQASVAIAHAMAVRRLTPRECERLQGFPNNYTLVPVRGKEAADGPRYKALGNSMAVPVMHWIGKRIKAANAP